MEKNTVDQIIGNIDKVLSTKEFGNIIISIWNHGRKNRFFYKAHQEVMDCYEKQYGKDLIYYNNVSEDQLRRLKKVIEQNLNTVDLLEKIKNCWRISENDEEERLNFLTQKFVEKILQYGYIKGEEIIVRKILWETGEISWQTKEFFLIQQQLLENQQKGLNNDQVIIEGIKKLEDQLNNKSKLSNGVTKTYLWEKVRMIHKEEDWSYNPNLFPPTTEGIELLKFIQEDEQNNILIIGDAGIGKSSLVRAYLKKYNNYYSDDSCCRTSFMIRLNQYNRYKKEAFENKNQMRQDVGIKQEFLILLDLIIQTYELREENRSDVQTIREGLLGEFCKKTVNGNKEYIIVLEDFHSLDPSIRNWVKKEIQSVANDWHNVSLIMTERTKEAILPNMEKVLHLQPLSMEQVLSYMEDVLIQSSANQEWEHSILKTLRSNHVQQFLRIPQFTVIYASFLRNQGEHLDERQFPKTAAQVFSNYFFEEVRLRLSRNERDHYFASDSNGVRMMEGQVISYEFIAMITHLLLPALAFEMEKMPQKALTPQQFRMVIRKFMPLFPIKKKQGIYRERFWVLYLEFANLEQKKRYTTIWREFTESWKNAFSEKEQEILEEYYEDDIATIFLDCMKILTIEQNQYCFFHDSYQEFFCAYYYYQKFNYWETMGNSILEEDWDVFPSENVKKYLGELLLSIPELKLVYQTCEKTSVCRILAKACYYNFKNYSESWLEEERRWVEKQEELGDPYAYYFFALLEKKVGDEARKQRNWEEVQKRAQLEVRFMKRAAEADICEAYYYMGIYHQQGKVVEMDYELARKYFYHAMESGSKPAIVKLAGLLEQNFRDPLGAIYYYLKGAEENIPQAYTSLARLVQEKQIISGSPKLQEKYLKLGALQLDHRSICDLADFYLKQGNNTKAIEWYQMGVRLKNNRAICSYGICLENGIGIEKNEMEAYQYYEKAEMMGRGMNPKIILCKAICYIWGKGVSKDIGQAKELLKQGLNDWKEKKNGKKLAERELQLKEVFTKLLCQIEQNKISIRRNYIEIEDYVKAMEETY